MSETTKFDATKLRILTDLREDSSLTLSKVAEIFGLSTQNGYAAVSKWESGVSAPQAAKRDDFKVYLWDHLRLRQDTEKFEEVWKILVEEWGWKPISDDEWQKFTKSIRPTVRRESESQNKSSAFPLPEPERPRSRERFVGRQEELSYFSKILDETGTACITGVSGVGKTALAIQLAMQTVTTERLFWHVCYENHDIQTVAWALAEFLAWRGDRDIWVALQNGARPPIKTLMDCIFQSLKGQGILLCFDDFHEIIGDPSQKELVDRLFEAAGAQELSLVITSRRVIDLDHSYEQLNGLNQSDTEVIFATQGVELPDELFIELHSLTEGNPELLVLALQAIQQTQQPAKLISKLVRTEQVKQFLMREIDDGLDADERMVMRGVAALLGYPGTADAIEEVLDMEDIRHQLYHLVNRFMLQSQLSDEEYEDLYSQHYIVQTFYYDLLGQRRRKALHQRAAEYYQFEEPDMFRAALHYHHANELTAAAELATDEVLTNLYSGRVSGLRSLLEKFSQQQLETIQWAKVQIALGYIYKFVGESSAAQASYRRAVESLETQMNAPNARNLLAAACRGMVVLLRVRQPQEAMTWVERGLDISTGIDLTAEADLRIQKGIILTKLDNSDSVRIQIEHGLTLLDELAPSPETARLRILALLNLGVHMFLRNDFDEAIEQTQRALLLATSRHDIFNEITLRSNLATIYQRAERFDEAAELYEEVITQAQKWCSVVEHARIVAQSGVFFLEQHELHEAQQRLETSLTVAQDTKHVELCVMCLTYLGDLHYRAERFENAIDCLQQAENMAKQASLSVQLTTIYRLLAQIYLQENKLAKAKNSAKQAVLYARKFGATVEEKTADDLLTTIESASNIQG